MKKKLDTTKLPLISVLTPVLNAMTYLDECLESVRKQSYPNIEHVFADGGSTDGTVEKLQALVEESPEFYKLSTSSSDNGVGSALQRAAALSSGEIISWLDADDRLETDAIAKASRYFIGSPNIHFIYGHVNIINNESKTIGKFVIREFDKWEWVNRWHYIVFCGTFFRRNLIQNVGFVNDLGNDLDFYLRVSKKYSLTKVPDLFSSWRLHNSGISLSGSSREYEIRRKRAQQDFVLVLKNHGSLLSPKSLLYVVGELNRLAKKLKLNVTPLQNILKKVRYLLELSIAQSVNSRRDSFAKALLKRMIQILQIKMLRFLKKGTGLLMRFGSLPQLTRFFVVFIRHLYYHVSLKMQRPKE